MSRAMRSQRFLVGLAIGLLLAGGGWGILLLAQMGRPSPESQWVEQAYAHKLGAAQQVRGRRMLIVGGSGAMFGLDSVVLAKGLGLPVINLSVNAGIQSAYIRLYARQALRPGDWVLFPLEYPLFHDRFAVSYPFLDYWLSHPSFSSLGTNPVQLARIYWQASLYRIWLGLKGLPDGFAPNGLYGPQNLDINGDQVRTEASRQEPWMREAVQASPVHQYGREASPLNATWSEWQALAEEVERQGGCAVFIPPALLNREAYHRGKEHAYYAELPDRARAEGLNYHGEPFSFMYPEENFFDTNYHLNAEARKRHTEAVLKVIRPAFGRCANTMQKD
ncbi:hypothetical protein [Stutzerimonas kunmingensis]|uniref:hypothetical protein n=1 Tax=Stutzerimonas kunmingensis TaxID=1211807 RepID=UPI002899D555|nr:hypothetical protein [Stutzerimonas kunmingensis]